MRKPLRVLIVDDNEDLVTTTMELVRLMGHQAHGCYSGKQAIECVEEYDPDVVVMDIRMPQMSGWDAAKAIRDKHPAPKPLLIAITGEYKRGADKVLFELNGFDFYLVKPADPKVLQTLIEKAADAR